jgi:hypothetical protein
MVRQSRRESPSSGSVCVDKCVCVRPQAAISLKGWCCVPACIGGAHVAPTAAPSCSSASCPVTEQHTVLCGDCICNKEASCKSWRSAVPRAETGSNGAGRKRASEEDSTAGLFYGLPRVAFDLCAPLELRVRRGPSSRSCLSLIRVLSLAPFITRALESRVRRSPPTAWSLSLARPSSRVCASAHPQPGSPARPRYACAPRPRLPGSCRAWGREHFDQHVVHVVLKMQRTANFARISPFLPASANFAPPSKPRERPRLGRACHVCQHNSPQAQPTNSSAHSPKCLHVYACVSVWPRGTLAPSYKPQSQTESTFGPPDALITDN